MNRVQDDTKAELLRGARCPYNITIGIMTRLALHESDRSVQILIHRKGLSIRLKGVLLQKTALTLIAYLVYYK